MVFSVSMARILPYWGALGAPFERPRVRDGLTPATGVPGARIGANCAQNRRELLEECAGRGEPERRLRLLRGLQEPLDLGSEGVPGEAQDQVLQEVDRLLLAPVPEMFLGDQDPG